ncbi:hypothetical protein HF673_01220 [Acidithiobacillus thiooxidans]|uniref:Uncharacterized protein n=2 Tax=Acidithiobacillus thiooxidans TaxID=930 RepID=A0A1C2I991_ACITH|nr:hypothetical protein [Acidithiobacillus thiooxidans]MBU2834436.1 hypothetical protein [Acidithiobacillus thiooxidans]OCX72517.1 hypothetical protein A6M23_09755 [Acidithiobacillus thiooxidans]OCX83501.1 hypothetical protein A6P08_10400 [Acidithiobacillus thiooxidans]QFX96695.1 hypothetical protein GCD22_02507 [Acidithiobacillus thiooxidans ATCC 19377]
MQFISPKFNPYHKEKRVTITNRVDKVTGEHIVLKRGSISGRAWLKTGKETREYTNVQAALDSIQMSNAQLPF